MCDLATYKIFRLEIFVIIFGGYLLSRYYNIEHKYGSIKIFASSHSSQVAEVRKIKMVKVDILLFSKLRLIDFLDYMQNVYGQATWSGNYVVDELSGQETIHNAGKLCSLCSIPLSSAKYFFKTSLHQKQMTRWNHVQLTEVNRTMFLLLLNMI